MICKALHHRYLNKRGLLFNSPRIITYSNYFANYFAGSNPKYSPFLSVGTPVFIQAGSGAPIK